MALTATVYKADCSMVDIDKNYYADHQLTLVCQPSETHERMMMRLLAFALDANPDLQFAAGMMDNDEPDLWHKDLTGAIDLWLEVGQPDEKRILKACGRSNLVKIYTYHGRPQIWWNALAPKVEKARNLEVYSVNSTASKALVQFVQRNINIQVTIQDGAIWVRNDNLEVEVTLTKLNSI
jgi:uncharacterized protein YaeQ